jgi:hypothetical protein
VHGAGDQLLARAGFAGDERRAGMRRQSPDHDEQLLHRGVPADHAGEFEMPRRRRIRGDHRLPALLIRLHHAEQPREPLGQRFTQIISAPS